MRLYDYGPSQNCFKVRLLASHLGLELETVPVSIFEGAAATPEFLAKNPMGAVPVLEYSPGRYMPESNAILTFLAEGSAYLPPAGIEHAEAIRWLMFEQQYVQPTIGLVRYWTLTGKTARYEAAAEPRRALAARVLAILDAEFGDRPFITGDQYTIADMSLFAYCHLAEDADCRIDDKPNFLDWTDRVRAQPGFAGEAIPYAEDPAATGRLPLAG